MITVVLDDKKITVDDNVSVAQILHDQGYVQTHFAVAVNQQFVPRCHYVEHILVDNDVVDIIIPMQGG